jgi:hypothetical protein
MKAEKEILEKICKEISGLSLDDAFTFSFAGVALLSQPHMDYPGYRITLNVSFAKMKDKIHIDVGIGDAVEPQHLEIKLFQYRGKPFFEDTISLLVYPIETIFAEKLETVQLLGTLRTFDWLGFKDKFLSPSNLVIYKPLANIVSRRIQ